MITTVAGISIGLLFGMAFYHAMLRRNKSLYAFMKAVKTGSPIAMLEDNYKVFFRPIKSMYQNIATTYDNELIIVPSGSMKHVANLKNVPIVHGDFELSIGVPTEVRKFMKQRLGDGWTDDDIANMMAEIEKYPDQQIRQRYKLFKKAKKPADDDIQDGDLVLPEDSIERKKYHIYESMPTTVKSFILTGVNRANLMTMMDAKVVSDRIRLGKKAKNFIAIAILVFLILMGVGIMIKFAAPGLAEIFGGGASSTAIPNPLERIAP